MKKLMIFIFLSIFAAHTVQATDNTTGAGAKAAIEQVRLWSHRLVMTACSIEKAQECLDQGADINHTLHVSGTTALIKRDPEDQQEVILFLIKKGADVNAVETFGCTVLWKAICHYKNSCTNDESQKKYLSYVKELLEAGAVFDSKREFGPNKWGQTLDLGIPADDPLFTLLNKYDKQNAGEHKKSSDESKKS